MKTEIVYVTPQMASDMLTHNAGNRRLRRSRIEGIKDSYARGEYIITHQGIAFSKSGKLLDGQHRLTAISEMLFGSYPMLVTTGLSEEAFKAMDVGVKRTAADALQREDQRVVQTASLIAKICTSNRSGVTPTLLMPVIDNIEREHNALMAFCPLSSKVWSSTPVRIAAVMSIKLGQDLDFVRSSYHSLVTGKFSTMTPAAQAIYKSNVEGRVRATDHLDMIARCLIVFDESRSDRTRVQVKDSFLAGQAVRQVFGWLVEGGVREQEPKKKAVTKRAAKLIFGAEFGGPAAQILSGPAAQI